MAEINRITNGNVYINGENFLGRCEEATLPDVKQKETEHKGLGMVGTIMLPSGLEAMTAKLKMASFYPDVVIQAGNPNIGAVVQVRANLETWESEVLLLQQALVALLVGRFTNFPFGTIKSKDNAEYELNMTVTRAVLTLDGVPLYEVDIMNNIWIVNGIDLLAAYRLNIGG